jgi:hypothetical protein
MHLLSVLVRRLAQPHDIDTHCCKAIGNQALPPLRLYIIYSCICGSGGSACEHIKMRNYYLKRETMRTNCGSEADQQRSYA